MGKIRIYELARELNMTNAELVDRLHEIEYPVKSHMSSIDESDLPDVKAKLSGKKKTAKLVEKRIKPTVIRRRRVKTVKKPKIIEETSQPEMVADEAPPVAVKDTKAEPVQKEEMPAEAAAEAPEGTLTAQDTVAEPLEKEAPEAKKAEPVKPVKKKKKDTPAKIIKPAPPPKETDPAEAKIAPAKPKKSVLKPVTAKAAPPDQEPSLKDKKKKGRKKTEPVEPDRKFFKKKISFRKKEVVEGKDLYSASSKRLRKGKKGPNPKWIKA